MPAVADNSTIAEHIRLRRPRNQAPILYSDPTTTAPHIPSLIQSTRCKSSISSLLFSTFSTATATTTANDTTDTTTTTAGNSNSNNNNKKKNFTSSTFRGLGCAAPPQVSVPAVIRTSADWEAKKVRKKKQKKKGKTHLHHQALEMEDTAAVNPPPAPPPPPPPPPSSSSDVWCGPGIGFSAADAAAASVDCVVSRKNASGRGKIDGEKVNQRERSSYSARRTSNPDHFSLMEFDSAFGPTHSGSDVFGSRYYRHVRHRSPEGLAEILMLQSSLLMGGRLDGHDRFRDWRLDVDNMTYEELLELGDRIGNVSTGLREDEISRCLRKIKLSILDNMPSHFSRGSESKCSICQEEYEADDEMGKLSCGHAYHLPCIKHWLVQKNKCPVCKSEVAALH